MNGEDAINKILETFEAPWHDAEFEVQSKKLRDWRFGVKNKNGRSIARYITEKEAKLITIAPEMLMLVEEVALDSMSPHRQQAKTLLEMLGWEHALKKLEAKVKDWNARVKNGDMVIYDNGTSFVEGRQWHEATILGNHTAVVWIGGISGCVSMDRCKPKINTEETS